MKINISDMFDHIQDLSPDINISETNKFDAASKRIKEPTFKKYMIKMQTYQEPADLRNRRLQLY